MAVFDPAEQRICVRVVYDGAASAGKTTNVRQLASLFTAQKKTDVVTAAELRGRTLYFDWLQLSAGSVCGFPLICQVVSVPGQAAFGSRRNHLLASADVVVFVCDSSKEGIELARDALLRADELILPSGDPIPVVIQANKQDHPDALDGKQILNLVRRRNVHVVEAIATEGIGVIDTFVSAVRTAAREIQARVENDGLRVAIRRVDDEQEVLQDVAALPIDKYGAAELFLEEANAAYNAGLMLASRLTQIDEETLTAPPTPAPPPVSGSERRGETAELPNADVPTGHVWPAHTGRTILRNLGLGGKIDVGENGVRQLVQDHVVTTSLDDHFADHDAARQALVRAARERTQLDNLLVSDTVLVVQPSDDGSSWLWTVTPKTEFITDWLTTDTDARTELLGAAIADGVVATLRHHLQLVASVHVFGVQETNVRYAGPVSTAENPVRAAIDLLSASLDDVSALAIDVELFVESLTRRLTERLREEEVAMLTRDGALSLAAISEVAKPRLLRALQRVAEAA